MPRSACSVHKCLNSTKKLQEYKRQICTKHHKDKGSCGCPLPFKHLPFPADREERKKWKELVYRQASKNDKTPWSPTKDSRICSIHFIDGKSTAKNPYPTLHMGHNFLSTPSARPKRPIEAQNATSTQVSSPSPVINDCSVQVIGHIESHEIIAEDWLSPSTDEIMELTPSNSESGLSSPHLHSLIRDKGKLLKEVSRLQQKCVSQRMIILKQRKQLNKLCLPVYKQLVKDDSSANFYTGIPSHGVFSALCTYAKKHESVGHKISSSTHLRTSAGKVQLKYHKRRSSSVVKRKLCMEDIVLLTLMKLRLGSLRQDLAFRFSVAAKDVTYIINKTVKLLAAILKPLIVFYPQHIISKTLPKEYKHYKQLRCIIDCTELFIHKPSELKLQSATWSDYKHHNTLKALIAITPQGSVAYVSQLWGGRASDRHIVKHSGFLEHMAPGDQVLADRGFPIREELLLKGAHLVLPPAAKGKSQMTSTDVAKTKKVANVRIHVERVIRRIKTFRILSQTIPISLLPLVDDMFVICCAIANMKGPLVSSWDEVVPQSHPNE